MNINILLQNSVRTELFGRNIFTFTPSPDPRKWNFEENGRMAPSNIWKEPDFALKGTLGIGHHTDKCDLLTMEVCLKGIPLIFHAVRHLWTPAYMETYYRCEPFGEYKRSGLIIIKERKCITGDDVFVSEITAINDDNEPLNLEFKLSSAFPNIEPSIYKVNAKTLPKAIGKQFDIDGYFALSSQDGTSFTRSIPAFSSTSFTYSGAYHYKKEKAVTLSKKLPKGDVFLKNEESFNNWFEENVPKLKTDNLLILKTYYYRWYLVYRNSYNPKKVIPDHTIKGYAIYESNIGGWYGCPVGLPFPMQLEDAKWMKNLKIPSDHLKNWTDGMAHGYIQFTPLAAWHFYKMHKDISLSKEDYYLFKAYTLFNLTVNASDNLPVSEGSWLTGAEYQPSFYQHTPTPWDFRYDNMHCKDLGLEKWPLYRLDEIMFAIGNLHGCEQMAKELSLKKDARELKDIKDKLISVLKEKFWDKDKKMFFDVDVKSGKRCDEAPCYDSFAPLMWNIIKGKDFDSSVDAIFNKDMFNSEFLIPSVSKTCPMFWPDNALTGPAFASKENPYFYGCCWNGPVWPYANTLTITALGDVAKRNKKYKKKWLELFENYTNLHYMCGDFSVPDIVEHYRHSDGTPFSATHDYFHSCFIDPFMKYWAGIEINGDKVTFNPFTDEECEISDVLINGKYYKFSQYKEDKKLVKKITIL